MTYKMECPAGDYTMTVDAPDEDGAVALLVEQARAHGKEDHPEMPDMSDEDMADMVRTDMVEEGAENLL